MNLRDDQLDAIAFAEAMAEIMANRCKRLQQESPLPKLPPRVIFVSTPYSLDDYIKNRLEGKYIEQDKHTEFARAYRPPLSE